MCAHPRVVRARSIEARDVEEVLPVIRDFSRVEGDWVGEGGGSRTTELAKPVDEIEGNHGWKAWFMGRGGGGRFCRPGGASKP